jgi:hypothetical protein
VGRAARRITFPPDGHGRVTLPPSYGMKTSTAFTGPGLVRLGHLASWLSVVNAACNRCHREAAEGCRVAIHRGLMHFRSRTIAVEPAQNRPVAPCRGCRGQRHGTAGWLTAPGATDTVAVAIDDRGEVVGYCEDSGAPGFTYDNSTFTTLDPRRAESTAAQIFQFLGDPAINLPAAGDRRMGSPPAITKWSSPSNGGSSTKVIGARVEECERPRAAQFRQASCRPRAGPCRAIRMPGRDLSSGRPDGRGEIVIVDAAADNGLGGGLRILWPPTQ